MENRHSRSVPYDGMHWIVEDAYYIDEYRIRLWFRDGSIKIVDLKDLLFKEPVGEVFIPLRDKEIFSKVKYDLNATTIVFPNGVDLAPEYLYEIGVDS